MRALMGIAAFALMSCNGPSIQFRDRPATRIQMDGYTFNIFLKENRAEAVRIGYVPRRDLGRVYLSAARAMEAVSGCKVIDKTMRGDPAQMWARLSCRGNAPALITCQRDKTHQDALRDLVVACQDQAGTRAVVVEKR